MYQPANCSYLTAIEVAICINIVRPVSFCSLIDRMLFRLWLGKGMSFTQIKYIGLFSHHGWFKPFMIYICLWRIKLYSLNRILSIIFFNRKSFVIKSWLNSIRCHLAITEYHSSSSSHHWISFVVIQPSLNSIRCHLAMTE